jgi:NAD(P)-dependent dehydrogenase (short-subunit alcohol dehydrogenase family)
MQNDLFDLSDSVIIVTGGMGQLGRQYTLALADRGAKVAVFDMDVNADRVKDRFGDRSSDEALMFVESDVTSRASIEEAVHQVERAWGSPTGLINNAALDSPPGAPAAENGPFEDYPEASFDKVMEVNTKGVFLCCQVIGGAMAAAGRGSIVNVCSIYGVLSPDQRIYEYRRQGGDTFYKPVAYSISKSSLLNLTRYLATYWAENGVRVNSVTLAGVFNNQDEEFLTNYNPKVPLGRMANEDEYNGAMIYLMSKASSYMTGSNMIIDGGFTAW